MRVEVSGSDMRYINDAPHIDDGTLYFTHLGIRWMAPNAAPEGTMSRTPPKELLDEAKMLAELAR